MPLDESVFDHGYTQREIDQLRTTAFDKPKAGLPATHRVSYPKSTAQKITGICEEIKQMLLDKNRAYGDSAIDPVRVFSKADATEQLKVRIDDKLSRLMRGDEAGEDVINDLIGYLILLKVAQR